MTIRIRRANALDVGELIRFVNKGFEADKDTIGAGTSDGVVGRCCREFGSDDEKAVSG